jgi:hypothetical protein
MILPVELQRLQSVSTGRVFAFGLAYGLAVIIMGLVCVILLLILQQAQISDSLRWAGFITIPGFFCLYIFAALRIFRLFGQMFLDKRRRTLSGW